MAVGRPGAHRAAVRVGSALSQDTLAPSCQVPSTGGSVGAPGLISILGIPQLFQVSEVTSGTGGLGTLQ